MRSALYPKLLVFLQFGLIGLMLLVSHGFFSSLYELSVFIMGLCIGLWALKHNRIGNFNIQPKLKEGSKLITTGIYRYIRHPMYTSVIVMMFAILISTPTMIELLLFLSLIIVLVLKALKEESLWVNNNKAYIQYKKNTKLFIPYIL